MKIFFKKIGRQILRLWKRLNCIAKLILATFGSLFVASLCDQIIVAVGNIITAIEAVPLAGGAVASIAVTSVAPVMGLLTLGSSIAGILAIAFLGITGIYLLTKLP